MTRGTIKKEAVARLVEDVKDTRHRDRDTLKLEIDLMSAEAQCEVMAEQIDILRRNVAELSISNRKMLAYINKYHRRHPFQVNQLET